MKTCKSCFLSLLSLGLLLTLFGCKQEADGIYFCYPCGWPGLLLLRGRGGHRKCGSPGHHHLSVNISQGPEIDDQANRSDWVGTSYGTADGRMYLYYDNHWLKCYLPAEIG